jgi:signal transduction histidine kinase
VLTWRPAPWPTKRSRAFDIALVATLLLPVLTYRAFEAVDTTTALLSAAQIAPLLLRRSAPVLGFGLVASFMGLQLFLTDAPVWGQVAMPVAVYSMAVYAPRRAAMAALGVGLAGAILGPLDWKLLDAGLENFVRGLVFIAMLVVAPWALGMWIRTRRAYVAQLVERGHRLEREAAQQVELAASDERARIAREMHDVVAHGLSVMIVQADGARYAVHRSPEAAAAALETIAASGREALAEMRRMLGLLRSDHTETGTRPQPGLGDLDYLVEQSRASGMRLEASIGGPLPETTPGVGLTVYRVVQEALTNVRKHAGPQATAQLSVRADEDEIVVEVVDDGRGAAAPNDQMGHGLIGMRERVAVHSGRLDAGPRPGGGYVVRAVVPFDRQGAVT